MVSLQGLEGGISAKLGLLAREELRFRAIHEPLSSAISRRDILGRCRRRILIWVQRI